jgi:hypothetical protein
MKDQELQRVAEEYRKDGYTVVVRPSRSDLPTFLRQSPVDLLAQNDRESVAVRVVSRDQLYDLNPPELDSKPAPGWRYDLVVLPIDGKNGESVLERPGVKDAAADSLIQEAERLAGAGMMRAAMVMALSAVEVAMRDAARREKIDLAKGTTSFALKTLYTNGLISREELDRASECLSVRNEIVHGLQTKQLTNEDIQFLIRLARQLALPTSAEAV